MAVKPESWPAWAERIRHAYLAGETSMFMLHGNVFDRVLREDRFQSITQFLGDSLLQGNKQNILVYEPSSGVTLVKGEPDVTRIQELRTKRRASDVLPLLEVILRSTHSTAVIIPYASSVVPAGEMHFLSEPDRLAVVSLHRWSLDASVAGKDNVVFLLSEALTALHPMLVSNPRIGAVEIPLPEAVERLRVIQHCDASLTQARAQKLADHTAGLRAVQIEALLTPRAEGDLDDEARRGLIEQLLGQGADAAERAVKLSSLTRGMAPEEIEHLLAPGALAERKPASNESAPDEMLSLLHERKRAIIERECGGLIEFLEPRHDLSAVGGADGIKEELRSVATAVREGQRRRIPMGLLFVGPMGCGKTFVANAFIRETGLTAVRLKNFRSRWVGSTEANLEKVLGMIRSLGPIVLVIDEGDRAFGSGGDSDGGTSSRVIGRIKEFMSDPANRGRVLFILMTNRPDKLDVDIKRAGRLDRKIPFFYAEREETVEQVLEAILRRHEVRHEIDWTVSRSRTSSRLLGYSNADLEAVVLMANELAEHDGVGVDGEQLSRAIDDYVPSRDEDMLQYMELLAAFEASKRSLLPERLRSMTTTELNQALREKRAIVAQRKF